MKIEVPGLTPELAGQVADAIRYVLINCKGCDTPLIRKSANQKFCSNKCFKLYQYHFVEGAKEKRLKVTRNWYHRLKEEIARKRKERLALRRDEINAMKRAAYHRRRAKLGLPHRVFNSELTREQINAKRRERHKKKMAKPRTITACGETKN